MAKKVKYGKLETRNQKEERATNKKSSKSAFSTHSEKVQKSKEKRIEKINETRDRVMNKKKENKSIKMGPRLMKGNKINKFSLLDEPNSNYQPAHKLTHKGHNFQTVKHFDDVEFNHQDAEENSYTNNFDQLHNEVNFYGFDEQKQLQSGTNSGERKSKNEIYKEIIEKSKSHKRDRQEQYQTNLNAAMELDEQFPEFVGKLKFRNNDSKVREKMQKRDLEYERLMNELRQDERVVANRVVDNKKKGMEKVNKKKNEQLNQLMMNSDNEEEEDIRGWIKNLDSNSEGKVEEQNEDEIDEVDLSSDQDSEQQEEYDIKQERENSNDSENFQFESQRQQKKIKGTKKKKKFF